MKKKVIKKSIKKTKTPTKKKPLVTNRRKDSYKETIETAFKENKVKGKLGVDVFRKVREALEKKGYCIKEEFQSKAEKDQFYYIEDLFTELLEQHEYEERNAIVEEICREIKALLNVSQNDIVVRSGIINVLDSEQII